MSINVSFDYPPIPIRGSDWSACVDGKEEDGPYGRGETKGQALADLGAQLAGDGDTDGLVEVLVALIKHDINEAENDGRNRSYILGLEAALRTVRGII